MPLTMTTLTNPALTAAICDLEHRAWSALCTSGSDLLPLLSANPVMIFPGDTILTAVSSPTVSEMLHSAEFKPWKSYTLSHDEVIALGSDSALIYYRVTASRGDEGEDQGTFRAICSSAWVMEENNGEKVWKMASHQQTLI